MQTGGDSNGSLMLPKTAVSHFITQMIAEVRPKKLHDKEENQ